jgi:hypothetical protein
LPEPLVVVTFFSRLVTAILLLRTTTGEVASASAYDAKKGARRRPNMLLMYSRYFRVDVVSEEFGEYSSEVVLRRAAIAT